MIREAKGEAPPLEAKTLLAFGRANKAVNLLAFLIFGKAKNSQIAVLFCKMIFYKSHIGMIKCPESTLMRSIFSEGSWGQGQGHGRQLPFALPVAVHGYKVWKSAVISPSGVRSGTPVANAFLVMETLRMDVISTLQTMRLEVESLMQLDYRLSGYRLRLASHRCRWATTRKSCWAIVVVVQLGPTLGQRQYERWAIHQSTFHGCRSVCSCGAN